MVTFEEVKENPRVTAYLKAGDEHLEELGYTEHGFRHAENVANNAYKILKGLGRDERTCELARIAGYLHDIGNMAGRVYHPYTSTFVAFNILLEMKMKDEEIATIMGAIGNHEETEGGKPVNDVSAAIIIADKADVHRSRVRNLDFITFDIHDRVNYAVENSQLDINKQEKTITLSLKIDNAIGSVMEYFEIFLHRMIACRRAADFLDCKFKLEINKVALL